MLQVAISEGAHEALAAERYDLVIIGGGIYGVMISLEARRGLHP